MPRYSFHIHDGQEMPDRDGIVLVGEEDADAHAIVAAGEALKDLGPRRMHVTDEQGATVCDLRLSNRTRPS
jgi:hypothetical protein